MPKANDKDISEGYEERTVHTEPMHATFADKLGDAAALREQIAEATETESAEAARARLLRSLKTLDDTVRRALRDVRGAVRGAAGCAATWARVEARALTSGQPDKRLHHGATR
jgi:hypothetical protein